MHELLLRHIEPLYTRRRLALWMLFSALSALIGPFGTFELDSFGLRLAYWGTVIVLAGHVAHVCRGLSRGLLADRHPIWQDLAVVLGLVAVFTPLLLAITAEFFRDLHRTPSPLPMAGYVAAISVGVVLARRLLPGFEEQGYFGTASGAEPEPAQHPRLTRRLPDTFTGPIYRLSSNDHMVEVVAACDNYALRMRFVDAIAEMDGVTGHCAHRSHWVTRDAIAGVERDSGKIGLRLVNGDLVPVSRKYRPGLEEAGIV